MIHMSKGEKLFSMFNYGLMGLLLILMIYPFWYLLMGSISDAKLAAGGGLFLIPAGFSLDAYKAILNNSSFLSSLKTTVIVTLAGTFLGTFFTATTAYAISKKRLRGGGLVSFLILFTMLFNGGLVPSYLLVKMLNLMNTYWALILPNLLSAFNIFVMRSFFKGIPDTLEEAAKIDGANDLTVFFKIVLPLSKPVLATIGLFIAVFYWNDFFSTILYISDKDKWQLQAFLRDIISNTAQVVKSSSGVGMGMQSSVSEFTVRMASIIVATVPILVVYPFLQKHFAKGAMIGSIKG
ncbi:carbohydrate ABC transporter permease [Lederbergia wuyishanensis]|uniref:Aldouronate transport system permease protein n=1 Tax=Lederbergia wuyishanensis TaxID=1347903 RepID=A0ABU0D364_9BACI|nr:carbohydrate ABC transporter permease [Lederbergia wuyishanensis]MCJ8008008.1 carbohydrate ABC transporter permease [Lederbergia wuyishanensis]MDQ0342821.1 putative aldouronate transport system permease protein [Lederbergia wuyishanensis]